MSAPKFDCWNIQLGDDVKATYVGRTEYSEALIHPEGWTFVILDDCTYLRTPKNPVWTKIIDRRPTDINIRIATSEDDHEPQK